MAPQDQHRAHQHHHAHLDEAHWGSLVAHAEREGEVLLGFVTDTAAWMVDLRGAAEPVRHVLDIGSGPGVGTCELARLLPDALVTAVDASPAMLEHATRHAAEHGFATRIRSHLAVLPGGFDDLVPAEIVWASMSLHHIGDEIGALRLLRGRLAPSGLLAIAEIAEPLRMLPRDLGMGRPGLFDRIEAATAEWFADMRADLAGSEPSLGLSDALEAAGFEVIGSRLARLQIDAPLADDLRRFVLAQLLRVQEQLAHLLDEHDRGVLEVLTDEHDARSVTRRPDVFIDASREIVIARPLGAGGAPQAPS